MTKKTPQFIKTPVNAHKSKMRVGKALQKDMRRGTWLALAKVAKKWLKKPRIITIKVRWVIVAMVLINAYSHHPGHIVYGDPITPSHHSKVKPVLLKPLPQTTLKPVEPAVAVPVAAPVPAPPPVAPVAVNTAPAGCGDNFYANYIYMHESGCNTNALNSIGCYGIGQACPASKIAQCGSDYACQNAWFSDYATRAYGGWAGAYAFWVAHSWW